MPRGRPRKESNTPLVELNLRANVFKRPEFLNTMPSKGDRAKAIAVLASQLNAIASDEAVVYSVPEFLDRFKYKDVKQGFNLTKSSLRMSHKIKARCAEEGGKVFIWFNRI